MRIGMLSFLFFLTTASLISGCTDSEEKAKSQSTNNEACGEYIADDYNNMQESCSFVNNFTDEEIILSMGKEDWEKCESAISKVQTKYPSLYCQGLSRESGEKITITASEIDSLSKDIQDYKEMFYYPVCNESLSYYLVGNSDACKMMIKSKDEKIF